MYCLNVFIGLQFHLFTWQVLLSKVTYKLIWEIKGSVQKSNIGNLVVALC